MGERERELWAHSAASSAHHYVPSAASSAPGLIKIYGDALSSGANYRSLLANVHSTASQLIAQVITRYTEREREETDDAGKRERRNIGAVFQISSRGGQIRRLRAAILEARIKKPVQDMTWPAIHETHLDLDLNWKVGILK